MKKIHYRDGYKYQLARDYVVQIALFPRATIRGPYIGLTVDGQLAIKMGYAWDGPSGPTIDTLNFMRGSLVHDALYQLIREGRLPISARLDADEILRRICIEDGMSRLRAWWVYQGVRFGGGAAAREPQKEPIEAPA